MRAKVLIALALAAGIPWKTLFAAGGLTAYSMVTRDGRRLVSHPEGTNEVFELVATNALPKDLPAVRPWTIYGVKATHTDIGLHNSQYIQRHGSVTRLADAAALARADKLGDDDPAAYRYVAEGYWFWHNTALDRGDAAAREIADDLIRRGRIGVGANCAGNHTHIFSPEELCRANYTRRALKNRWGIDSRTMIMTDNPGLSWSVVQPAVDAGIKNLLFSPNQWNPIPSTIWPRDKSVDGFVWNPDAGGGGARVDVRWDSKLPMVFWWEAPDAKSRLLVVACTQYEKGLYRFGVYPKGPKTPMEDVERKTARQLEVMNARYPFDVWIAANYADDEPANDGYAKFCREWNAKWATPTFATVGNLDEPFARLRKFGDKIRVLRGEMTSGWLQHIASTPELMSQKLVADRLLTEAEMRCAIASAKGAAYPAEDLRRAWWALICHDEHSYGTSGYQGRRVFETWAQHRDWLEKAERTAARFAGDSGAECQTPRASLDRTQENRWYRLTVNEKGEITSIWDKELGRELLNGIANRFLYTRDNHRTWEADPVKALGAELKQTVTLDPNEKKIYIDNVFTHARDLFNDKRYYRYGYYAFPFDVPKANFYAQLCGPVIDAFRDQTGHCTDAYVGAREWVAAENGDFGVALLQLDTSLVEFGEIHSDKTCCGFGKVPDSSAIYSYAFADWLQMHNPDGDSFNPRFRYVITSYRGTWQENHLPRVAERVARPFTEEAEETVGANAPNVILTALKAAEDGRGFIARFRETEGRATRAKIRQTLLKGAKLTRTDLLENGATPLADGVLDLGPYAFATVRIDDGRVIAFAPPTEDGWTYTELISRPRATHGERDGQLYLEWGVLDDPALDHYELWRADEEKGEFRKVADVKPEAPDGIPYRNTRYEERGLKTHTRYWYKVRPVFAGGRLGAFTEVFSGLTRYLSEEEKILMKCDWESGAFAMRYVGAQVTSWKPVALKGGEVFFLPKVQHWGEEVHGGVPVCWPWFGKAPKEGLPKHGLVRYANWSFKERIWKNGLVYEITSNDATRKLWPHDFRLELKVVLTGEGELTFTLTETNTGRETFESAWGFHPYFAVASALEVAVDGVRQATPPVQEAVREDGSHRKTLTDLVRGRTLEIICSDNEEWLVWNPGVERTPLCQTLGPDEWNRFFCVEPCTRTPRLLAPGESRAHVVTLNVTGK